MTWDQSADDVMNLIPEKFWEVSVWIPTGTWVVGNLDAADRHRIVTEVLRQIDGSPGGAK